MIGLVRRVSTENRILSCRGERGADMGDNPTRIYENDDMGATKH